MKLGSWYVERGEGREVRLALPTLSVWRAPVARTVIWGGRPDMDVWVGSVEDRERERYRRLRQRQLMIELRVRDSMTPVLRSLQRSFERIGRNAVRANLALLDSGAVEPRTAVSWEVEREDFLRRMGRRGL